MIELSSMRIWPDLSGISQALGGFGLCQVIRYKEKRTNNDDVDLGYK